MSLPQIKIPLSLYPRGEKTATVYQEIFAVNKFSWLSVTTKIKCMKLFQQ